MAGAATMMKVTCMVLACMVMVANAQVTCGTVSTKMAPCIGYLTKGGKPTSACCGGVRSLNSLANTTPTRQTACRCLQAAAKQIGGLNPGFAAGLPGACGVTIPYAISTSTNCNNVK